MRSVALAILPVAAVLPGEEAPALVLKQRIELARVNGRIDHFTWAIVEHAIQQRVLPDTISTDWGQAARTDQVFNFANVLSKFLVVGMPLDRVIACATANAAKTLPAFKGLGTLVVGAPADVAIMDLRQGSFEFEDNFKGKRTGRLKLVTTGAIFGGRRA